MSNATGVAAAPHNQTAIRNAFFKVLHGNRPTQLTAISPNRTDPIETKTLATEAEREAFLGKYDGKRNLYYTLNRMRRGASPNKKPTKEDFIGGEVVAFHVDVDPRVGETQEEARLRLTEWFANQRPKGVPVPTLLPFSGAGVQPIWVLKTPIKINSLTDIEEVERYNLWLAAMCEGDNCHNIDRVLRVTGTLNIPHQAKVKKGRVPMRAELIAYNPEALYEPSDFKQMPKQDAPSVRSAAPLQIDSSDVKRLGDLRELEQYGVSDRVMALCAQGHDPEDLNKYPSRSEALYDAVCQLVRAKVPDSVIYSIITDPAWPISEHVLAKRRGADKYAKRQIANAKIDTEDFELGGKDNKRVIGSPANIALAVHRLGVKLSYDEFAARTLIEGLPDFGPVLRDEAVNRMRIIIAERFKLNTDKQFFYDVVTDIAWRERFHPVRDYLDGLEWDGTKRIDNWLHTYSGAEDNEYTRAVGSLILLAAVRRVRQPGCKFDEMPTFEAPTGLDKSSALKVLAVKEEWFTDSMPLGRPAKEVIEIISGKWIVECAELEGLTPEKTENIKAFLSRTHDKARAAYGRLAVEEPRQNVFIGTTNLGQYLFDPTGNRRFWPVKIKKFDLDALKRDRDQLWAEAAAREAAGASVRMDQKLWAVAGEEQAARLAVDPWQERLAAVLGESRGVIKSVDVWQLLDLPVGLQTQRHAARLGSVMQALGFKRKQRRFNGGAPVGVYVRGNEEIEINIRSNEHGVASLNIVHPKPREVQEEAPF